MTAGLKGAFLSGISMKKYTAPIIKNSANKHIYDNIENKIKQYPSTDGNPKGDGKNIKIYKHCALGDDSGFCVYQKMEPFIDITTQRASTYSA